MMTMTTDPAQAAAAAQATPSAKTPKVTKTWVPLTSDEAKAALAVARPAVAPCLCGCGDTTKGRFAPGHDATHHQRLRATRDHGTPAAARLAAEALAAYGWAD